VLDFIKNNPRAAEMAEKSGRLRIKFSNINSVNKAYAQLIQLK
jgi:hypothetical protein